ncbi:MAG: type II secretion system F family protein [Clostridioides sp.]|jgi:type IV pilus assembly protein PilC|nr:type II secretion system F family protein [Clostridioides sp.]
MKSSRTILNDEYTDRSKNIPSGTDKFIQPDIGKSEQSKKIPAKSEKILEKSKKIPAKELRVMCKQIGILLESGCEIIKILTLASDDSGKGLKEALEQVKDEIRSGRNITTAFKNTSAFSNFFVYMISAAEISGSLDSVMDSLSKYYDKEYKLKSKIITIMIYPIILVALSFLSMLFILIFIVPNFQILFESNDINPPFTARVLIFLSKFLRENTVLCAFTMVVLIGVVYFIFGRCKPMIKLIKRRIFDVPAIGYLEKLIVVTKFTSSLKILFASGVPIIEAINISSSVVDNWYVEECISTSVDWIKRGNSISTSLERSDIFPKMFISMIKAGEESGRLDESLEVVDKFYQNELDIKIGQAIKLIEPMVIVVLGVGIGFCIISVVTPILDVISNM